MNTCPNPTDTSAFVWGVLAAIGGLAELLALYGAYRWATFKWSKK